MKTKYLLLFLTLSLLPVSANALFFDWFAGFINALKALFCLIPILNRFCDSCSSDPCINGVCLDKSGGYSCECEAGWQGNNCELDINECSGETPICDDTTEVCMNTEGSYFCDCIRNEDAACTAIDPVESTIVSALMKANPEEYVNLFPQEVIDQMVQDAPMVQGRVTFPSNSAEGQAFFEIVEGSMTNQITVEGIYSPPDTDSAIPPDLLARLYFQDGLKASASVDSGTGFFSLVGYDVAYGVSPFIVTFVSESYNGGGEHAVRFLQEEEDNAPLICMCKNSEPCGPLLSLTLTWDQPTSDVDLHVYEPGGAHVYYSSPSGENGAYLDRDDTDGFGPEHYFAPDTVFVGQNYHIQIVMYNYHNDMGMDVTWTLTAKSVGRELWTTTGVFRDGVTPSSSDDIPWVFEEQPVCNKQTCDSCHSFQDPSRQLALVALQGGCKNIRAPGNWKPADRVTDRDQIDEFYCMYDHYEVNPLWTADLLNKAAACILDFLTNDQKTRIIAGLGSKRDVATAIAAGKAVFTEFTSKRKAGEYVCRHHALALVSILEGMGYSASVEAALTLAGGDPHTWTEAVIDGERYILDCYNGIYIHVAKWKSPGCIYTASTKKVGCSKNDIFAASPSFDFECSTAEPSRRLPTGLYYIGQKTADHGVGWYNLYAERKDGGIWDYSTKIPQKYCRGGFGFHEGTASDGCVTVLRGVDNCFQKVKAFIESYPLESRDELMRDRFECKWCFDGICWKGQSEMKRIPLYPLLLLSK